VGACSTEGALAVAWYLQGKIVGADRVVDAAKDTGRSITTRRSKA
jgi:hypothetical protein